MKQEDKTMRDKVKRFISILMTALMLVNLLPVGALAEGVMISNSVQSRASETQTLQTDKRHVYVYARVPDATDEQKKEWQLNADKWYFIGICTLDFDMPNGILTKQKWGNDWYISTNGVYDECYKKYRGPGVQGLPAYNAVISKLDRSSGNSANLSIPMTSQTIKGYKLEDGVTEGYINPDGAFAWHLDIEVSAAQIAVNYKICYWDNNGNKIAADEYKGGIAGEQTEAIDANNAKQIPGYKYASNDGQKTIEKNGQTVVNVYYEPDVNAKASVQYTAESGGSVNPDATYQIQAATGKLIEKGKLTNKDLPFSIATPKPGYVFDGWYRINKNEEKKVSEDETLTTAEATDNLNKDNDTGLYESTVYHAKFKKAQNLSYTVHYYLEGTTTSVADDKVVPNQEFDAKVNETAIDVQGYNKVDPTSQNLTVTADPAENVITFYYTKRTDLSYTVNYLEKDTNKVLHEQKVQGEMTFDDVVKSEDEVIEINGYNYASADKETLTIGTGENVINIYYTKRNDLSYTVNYLEKDTNSVLHEAKTVENQTFGAEITSASEKIDISGYNYDSASPETLTIQADESKNVINLYYTKKTDLSYTVNYYWNGTNPLIPIKNSESGTETYGKTVNPDTDVPGYTLVPGQTTSLEIKDDPDQPNVLNLYYYKNVKLKANDTSRVYNGAKQTILSSEEYTVITTLDNQVVETTFDKEINVTGSGTDVGSNYTMYFPKKEIGIHNEQYYVVGYENGKLSITKRPVTLTSGSAERVYNGEALTKKEVTASTGENEGFVKGQGAAYDVTGTQTDVGTSDNTFTYTLNKGTKADNYSIELVFGKLEVTPVTDEVIVTITGRTHETTYDGKEHSVFGYDVTVSNALYTPKEDMRFNGIDADATAKGTDAGTYPMELTAENFTNISDNFTNVTFVVTDGYVKINPRAVTLTSETAGKTYDGTALEKPVVTVGGDGFVEGQVTEIKATGSVTNAGSVANTITFTPNKETFKDGNYAITKTEGTLTIAKRSVLITSQSATKTYDGSALTRPAVTITGDGFVPGELAKAEATGSITNVGSTPNAIRYTTTGAFNAANYSIALSVGTLTVTEKPKPEPRRTFNLTINYVYQNGKRAAASYNRGGLKNGETFDITSPVIAGYTASETVVSGTIYNRDIKVTVIYTADGVNLDDYGVPLGLGNITMNVGDCFE